MFAAYKFYKGATSSANFTTLTIGRFAFNLKTGHMFPTTSIALRNADWWDIMAICYIGDVVGGS